MINLIVYSKDRASQLDLLLRSIKNYAEGIFNIGVLWTSSDFHFYDAYKLLIKEYPSVHFVNQEKHKIDFATRKVLVDLNEKSENTRWTCFSTDDMVFFKPLPVSQGEFWSYLPSSPDEVFSFRLGFNTIEQDIHQGTKQPPLNLYFGRAQWIAWNPHFYFPLHNYGYPLAVDTHVFHSTLVQEILEKESFSTTNELETKMQSYRHKVNLMRSFHHSVAVNIPVNNLSKITRAGETFSYSLEWLNEQFLAGKRINLDRIAQEQIVGCHQELSYELV